MAVRDLRQVELQILGMLVGEMSHHEIAFAMDLTPSDLESVIASIVESQNADDLDSLLRRALKNGLVKTGI